MPRQDNTLNGWLSTALIIGSALALYLGAVLAVSLLSGSAMAGAAAANALIFSAGLLWLRSARHRTGFAGPQQPVAGPNPDTRFLALTALALPLCWLVGQASALWLYSYTGSQAFDEHAASRDTAPAVLMLAVVLVLAPMGEEMLMRGVAYTRLRHHLPPAAAAVLTAGVFSLMHMNLVQILATLPLGLLLAAVYERSGRIRDVIVLHALFNLLSVCVPASLVAGVASLAFVLVGSAVLLPLMIRLYRPQTGTVTKVEVPPAAVAESAPS